MRLKCYFACVILINLIDCFSCKGYFTIVGSILIRHKTKYHVAITSQGFDAPQTLEIAIKPSKKENPDEKFEAVKNVTLENDKSQRIEFDLKGQTVGNYNLEVKSLTGDDFFKAKKLHMNTKKSSVFVQTDKAIYKPADKVQFRVLVLNPEMRPVKASKVSIVITDGAENRVKQFENVKLTKGVYQSEFQLSDLPVLGKWSIGVKVDSGKDVTKDFEVAEYVLPKFEVKIDANLDANFKDGKIRAIVKAKYTFGKKAKGNATITAEPLKLGGWNPQLDGTKVSKSVEVDGKKPVEFDIEKELGIKDKKRERRVELFATFTEELTGKEQNATKFVIVHSTPYYIQLDKSAEKFKPGLPFSVSAFVKLYDKDVPVSDERNPVKFTIKFYYDVLRTCTRRNYYSYGGFNNEETSYECREEKSYNESREVFLENGVANLDLIMPSNSTKANIAVQYLEADKPLYNIQNAESKNNEFIQVKLATEDPVLSKKIKIDVLATKPLQKLTYQVYGKGNLVLSESILVPNQKNFQIEFTPSFAMIPTAKVLVFYITEDGEIISDSTRVEFGNELRNFIDVKLSKEQAKPGDLLNIDVSSNPNSFVGLLGVDQSVLLLKKGNDIEQSTVFNEIEQYNYITKANNEWGYRNYDYHTYRDFDLTSIIITNAEKEYRRPHIPLYYPDYFYNHRPVGFGGLAFSSSAAFPGKPGPPSVEFSAAPMASPSFSHPPVYQIESDRIIPTVGNFQLPKPIIIEIRKDFPETWIFDSLNFDTNSSQKTLTKRIPDTITSWIITGFSIDPVTGLALTKQPSKFNVFQPFFVSTNLPYSIKRGEVVSIPILVFNYLDQDQETEVTLFNSEREFEFTEINEEENQVRRRKRSLDTQRKKKILVKSQNGVSVPFMIRPLKVGQITIKVVATSNVAGDGVERQLLVEPEGVTQFMNKAIFIDLRNSSEFKTDVSITIPPNAVPDSTRIEASAIGDILGPSIDNLDKLIKLPYGCGEQNMLNFVPNIVVLDYLTAVNKLSPEIETKAKKYMESGYQRELTYKHEDGSYSAFGKSDDSGSTWLTAFVAKSFISASKYILVEENIVEQALNFLAKVQKEDGSFPEVGHVSHKDMQGGSSKGLALTAYTLTSFLENKKTAKKYKNTVDKALNNIVANIDALEDNYTIAITSYALQLAKHELKDSLMAKLDSKAEVKNGQKYWTKELPKSDKENPWYSRPSSVNVEMTAYALQALILNDKTSSSVPIMKWLVGQRNKNGGFVSTQDTVVGLQALSKMAASIYAPNSHVDISLTHNKGQVTNININQQNALILQKHELSPDSRDFQVTAKGNGFSILQLSYRYNLNGSGEWPRFIIEPKVHENSNKEFLHLVVCTSFVPDDSADKSNMAVMEVSLPSGFTFDTDSLPELKASNKIKKVETKESETVIVIYFDQIESKNVCPEVKAYRTHSVAKQKPAPVIIYDYYDSSRRARNFYNPPEISLCDICDGAEECKADCEESEINIGE